MTELFFLSLHLVEGVLDMGGAFLISAVILTLGFIVLIFFTIFKRGYSMRKRWWYIVLTIAVCAAQAGYEKFIGEIVFAYFTLALGCVYFTIIFFIPERAIKISKEQLRLAQFFDKKAREEVVKESPQAFDQSAQAKEISVIKTEEVQKKSQTDMDLDFSHVKSVINRMDYFGLTQNDKKQVRDLEIALNLAERGEYTKEVKENINDGLGALLKIMAKYGI